MWGRNSRTDGRRYRRSRRLRSSRRGVVSVVGTLLALLVFFALFGIFITSYLPVWMTDNEVQFTSNSQAAMATFKSNIDLQYALGSPPVYTTPFQMQSQGIPLLATPTSGILQYLPVTPGVFANVAMSIGPGGGASYHQNVTLGTLTMVLPNRYYPPQSFQFADDAVVESQGGANNIVNFPPLFSVSSIPGNNSVTMSLVQLYGNATTTQSSGTQDVVSHFLFSDTIISNGRAGGPNGTNLPFTVTFKIGTLFPCAWLHFLNQTLTRAGLTGFTLLGSCPLTSVLQPQDIFLTMPNINYYTLFFAGFQIIIGVGTAS